MPGWEPWEPDEVDEVESGGCDYCGDPNVRDLPEPFGGKPCCDRCFSLLIGGNEDAPSWRCAHYPTHAIDGLDAAMKETGSA